MIRTAAVRVLDKLVDYGIGLVAGFLIATGGSVVVALYHDVAHRRAIIATLLGVALGFLAGAAAALVRALEQAREQMRYVEAQKRLVRDALESIQEAMAQEEDWELASLVERGVLEPARGLLMRARFEDVRLAVLLPVEGAPDEWSMRWAAGHTPRGVRVFRRPIDKMLAGRAYRKGEIVVVPDVKNDPDFQPNPGAQRDFRSLIAIPLRVNDKTAGALSVVSTEPDAFFEPDVSFLAVIGSVLDVLLAAEVDARMWEAYAREKRAEEAEEEPRMEGKDLS